MASDDMAAVSPSPRSLSLSSPPSAEQSTNSPVTPAAVDDISSTKVERRIKWPEDYTPPTVNNADVRSDLEDMFGTVKVREMMKVKEPKLDSMMQRPQGQMLEDRERRGGVVKTRRGSERSVRKVGGKGKGDGEYQGLVLKEGTNWVLFDPLQDFQLEAGELPTFLSKYTYYQPGNTRILEYNTESGSIRTASVPAILEDNTVEYTDRGPRLVDSTTPTKTAEAPLMSRTRKSGQALLPELKKPTSQAKIDAAARARAGKAAKAEAAAEAALAAGTILPRPAKRMRRSVKSEPVGKVESPGEAEMSGDESSESSLTDHGEDMLENVTVGRGGGGR